jgi:hypothetical protein
LEETTRPDTREYLYLASLIRSPKWYGYSLERMERSRNVAAKKLLSLPGSLDKNMISPEELLNFNPNVMTKISEIKY